MSNVRPFEARWIALFDELRSDQQLNSQIAAPFLSVPATDEQSILYIGKATSGNFYRDDSAFADLTMDERIKERHEVTSKFIRDEAPGYPGGFWPFARQLNAALAKKWKSPIRHTLQHITWTNLCKIGALRGNPSGELFDKQRSLAVETLRWEIGLYHPDLIFL